MQVLHVRGKRIRNFLLSFRTIDLHCVEFFAYVLRQGLGVFLIVAVATGDGTTAGRRLQNRHLRSQDGDFRRGGVGEGPSCSSINVGGLSSTSSLSDGTVIMIWRYFDVICFDQRHRNSEIYQGSLRTAGGSRLRACAN